MKIAWFSEMSFDGKIQRTHKNMRTEYAWWVAQDAIHHNILKLQQLPDKCYDLGVIIIPKHVKSFMNFDIVFQLNRVCKKYAFMQEGPSWYFQSLPLSESLWFFNIMTNADFVLAHNDCDKEYYEGLLEKKCYINPTLMIEDPINAYTLTHINDRKGTIIGGNLVHWYGGFNSLMVANESGEEIYAPQMGRMEKEELQLDGINHLGYMEWDDWIISLSKFKYAIHLNPNSIGGTFYLNCAYLGIPCIGNKHANTQKLCFPDLSVEPNDIISSKKLIKKLRKDKEFYIYCSDKAKDNYKQYFHEEIYKKKWEKIIKKTV
tara:strand:+ start:992 stop:1945 length:954 start_codon:yes stop_codon:yes gene_type:complete